MSCLKLLLRFERRCSGSDPGKVRTSLAGGLDTDHLDPEKSGCSL